MRASRVAGLLFLATAALAQHQQSVEITSEPSHHLVFQNEYVRVFDVTVGPHATTLVHKHNYDYLFVTLGDSDVVSVRPGEKPVALKLKDGEVRFTPGNFAHAAINQSDRPFHNITIELLKPSTNEKPCEEELNCASRDPWVIIKKGDGTTETMPKTARLYVSDQWTVSVVTLAPKDHVDSFGGLPHLVVPVSKLDLSAQAGSTDRLIKRAPGQIDWLPTGSMHPLYNDGTEPARFILLEFKPEQQKQ